MNTAVVASVAALSLRALALVALAAAFVTPTLLAPPAGRAVRVVVDAAGRAEVATVRARLARSPTVGPVSTATVPPDFVTAMVSALGEPAAARPTALVLVGDGRATGAPLESTLALARRAGVDVYWARPAKAEPAARLVAVEAPPSAVAGQPITLRARIQVLEPRPLTLTSIDDEGRVATLAADAAPGRDQELALVTAPLAPGDHVERVELTAGGVDAGTAHVAIHVRGRARVLYVGAPDAPFATSLAAGGWPVDRSAPARLATETAALARYGAIVLDDVPADAPPADFWPALARAVREHGTGLITLGGPQSFAAGGYRGSPLEDLLPVITEPPATDERAAVAFVVDKSGSMGRTSAGVNRLELARSAVLDSAATLADQDEVAVIGFDVEPRLLVPLSDYRTARASLLAGWPIAAGGGTRIAPALALADAELARARSTRRYLLLITDGLLTEEPLSAVAASLAAHQVSLIVLAIGSDADLGALRPAQNALDAQLLQVSEVAALPRFARAALQRRRSAIRRGAQAVVARAPLPGLENWAPWPAVRALAVTRPRDGAHLYLVAASGEPLLASIDRGSGRSVALPAGLGDWTAEWLGAPQWPAFAGALLHFAERHDDEATLVIRVEEQDGALAISADLAAGSEWSQLPALPLEVRAPSGRVTSVLAAPDGPGRYSIRLPVEDRGAYRITALAGDARRTVVHVVGEQDSDRSATLESAVARGLLARWYDTVPDRWPRAAGDAAHGRRRLVALATLCWLAALVIVYRSPLERAMGRICEAAGAVRNRFAVRR